MPNDDVQKTLEKRGEQYGQSWKIAGDLMRDLDLSLLQRTPYLHNWMQILGKLIRAMHSPNDPEHWRDIAGYATLVLEDIKTSSHDLIHRAQASPQETLNSSVKVSKFYDGGGFKDLVQSMRGSVLVDPNAESGDHYDILPS